MNFTFHQLEIFLSVVEKKSVTRASEELFMTQPAVSIQLKKLQEQFDIPIYEVVNRSIHITEFGYELARSAKKIVEEMDRISQKTTQFKGLLSGKLNIMSVSTGKYIIPYLLTEFLKSHPGVELQLDVTNKNEVVRALEKNEIDFALISLLPNHLDLEYEILMENKLYFVGKEIPKAYKKMKIKDVFSQLPIIFRERGSGTRTVMESFLNKHEIKPKIKMELTSNEAVKQALLADLGYSLMPQIGIQREIEEGTLKILPLKGLPISTNWRLAWLKSKNLSPVAQAYLSFIKSAEKSVFNH